MERKQPEPRPTRIAPRIWLSHADQATAAALTLVAIALMMAYWFRQGGWQGRVIEVDALPVRSATFRVDVNRAAWTELAQIPEIGETLAKRIVEHREKHGAYPDLDSLSKVPGIGPRTLERMRPALKAIPSDTVTSDTVTKE